MSQSASQDVSSEEERGGASVFDDDSSEEEEFQSDEVPLGRPSRGKRGPPPDVEVDLEEFKRFCAMLGDDRCVNAQLAEHFGCTVARVKHLKRQHGLSRVHHTASVPSHVTFEWLQKRWTSEEYVKPLHRMHHVADARKILAMELGVSERALEIHMKTVGFNCMNPFTDEEVGACLRLILLSAWCCKIGVGFAETRLRQKYGMVVRRRQISRVLKDLDPEGVRRRTRKGRKKKGAYNVKGPRSLYHLDAHEKLAKVWGESPSYPVSVCVCVCVCVCMVFRFLPPDRIVMG